MLDRIVWESRKQVVLVFDNRPPITVTHDAESAMAFSLWIIADTALTFEEFEVALNEEITIANGTVNMRVG